MHNTVNSSEFADLIDQLPRDELQLDVLGVELTTINEARPHSTDAFDGAAELETFDSNGSLGTLARRQNGPHVRPQGVDRALEVLEPCREDRGARKARIDIVEQTA
jgi:hypothetical protein